MSSLNSRTLFVEVLFTKMEEQEATNSLLEITCKSNHSFSKFVRRIAVAMFNLFAKNLIADLNSEIHAERKRKPTVDDEEQKRDPVVMKAKKYKSN